MLLRRCCRKETKTSRFSYTGKIEMGFLRFNGAFPHFYPFLTKRDFVFPNFFIEGGAFQTEDFCRFPLVSADSAQNP